jgi:hypothetical protein
MSIRRNTDGSFNVNNRNEVSSIGITGGSFHIKRDPILEEKYHNWVEEYANIIQPCSHTIEETEQFFLQQCEAIPMDKDDRRMKSYQYSVVMNYFKDKLYNKISDFPLDMNDEAIEKWDKGQSDIYRQIMNNPPEQYGIKISGYYLPQTERNLYLYEEFKDEIKKITKNKEDFNMHTYWQDICFFFEVITEDIQCTNGGRSLINELFVFRGVREEDIKLRNAHFQGYLSSMRELGNLQKK